jgi:hypothetical protein
MRTIAVVCLALSVVACSGRAPRRGIDDAKPDASSVAAGGAPSSGEGRGRITPGVSATPHPGDAPPAAALSAARSATDGWYTSPVRVDAKASDDRGLEEVCFWVVPNYPRGTSTSSAGRPCPVSGKRWTGSSDLAEEARYIVQLLARDDAGQEVHADDLDVRIDLTPPASSFAAPAGAFRGSVVLDGKTTDASSGAARVVLAFTRPGEEVRRDATCACPGGWRRDRPPAAWRFEGGIAPGRWTVRAVATDHAGLVESPGPTVDIDVV